MATSAEQELQVSVQGGIVTVQVGKLHLSVPTAQVGDIAKAFSAAHILVGTVASPAAPARTNAPGAAAPSRDAEAAPRRRGRPPASDTADGGKRKRRSRKRVGEALSAWLAAHPGWYTEAELLDLVIREKMSDAEPNRALKIALGKQRDTFEQDLAGRWRLRDSAAPAAETAPKRGRGRPKGSGLKKAVDGNGAATPPKRGPGRPRSTPVIEVASGEAPARRKPGRPKGSGLKRAPREEVVIAVADVAPKPVRIKRGQSREEVLPRGRNAKAAAELDVDRIRRNLFSEPSA